MNWNWTAKSPRSRFPGMRPAAWAVLALLATGLLGACGQKGPLWVPGHAKNTPWPMKPAGSPDAPAGPAATPAPAPAAAPDPKVAQ